MAAAKLPLRFKSDSLPLVKKYAKRQYTSVSKLVQNLFDDIAEKEKDAENVVLKKFKNLKIGDYIKKLFKNGFRNL
jgi:hypothetical protein